MKLQYVIKNSFQATRPLQDALEMKIEKSWEIQSLKNLLPNPLYLLYSNVSAYAEACDSLRKNKEKN
jgi:THO complex subunit 5